LVPSLLFYTRKGFQIPAMYAPGLTSFIHPADQ